MDINTAAPSYHISTSDASNGKDSAYEYYDDDEYEELRKSLNIMSLIIFCLAFVFGVLGNGLVIWVTGFKMKKTINTVWFLNLAIADFLFTAFLPLSVAYIAMDFHWPFGKFMCKLSNTVTSLNMFASVFILVVISVDRCVTVVFPVWAQNHRSVRKASYVSLGVWLLALTVSAPNFVFRDTAPAFQDEKYINCFNNFSLSDADNDELILFRLQAITITCFLLGFVVPFTVIISCYAFIIHRLRRSHTLANKSNRTSRIIFAILVTFFLCWVPYHVMFLIEMVHFKNKATSETLDYITTIGMPVTTSLAYINSCLNPLLYVFVGQGFRDKVCKSIPFMLETAFQEGVSGSHTGIRSIRLSTKERSGVSEG